jgi:hypothetical protein
MSKEICHSFFDVKSWSLRAMHCEIFQRCELLNETITRCINSWQRNVMRFVRNLLNISLLNFNQKIICYYRHMKNVWSRLLDHDKNKMQLIDRVIIKIVEFIVSRAFKKNAQKLLNQIQSDEIFEVFNKKNRNQI